ncbi:UNKNOWN [Stylonychia lemnae]|uniref:Uncharacterized protein n=1 Tax=Stylonychia lemnae TaxID=5949 RepID=A0A078AJG2_STYLE|nr:UNKNOWN [Stylonychia lemnae]|eukprot:CDW82369.1 UNKNOWN [Stylonychia lemnae]
MDKVYNLYTADQHKKEEKVNKQSVKLEDIISPRQDLLTNEMIIDVPQNLEDIELRLSHDDNCEQQIAHEKFHHSEEDSPGIYLGTSHMHRGCEEEIIPGKNINIS